MFCSRAYYSDRDHGEPEMLGVFGDFMQDI